MFKFKSVFTTLKRIHSGREFILVIHFMNVRSEGKHLCVDELLNIREFIQERNHRNINKRIHTDDNHYECKKCEKAMIVFVQALNSGYQITQLQRIHTGKKLYEFKVCGKTFI
ncbi:hypothetical protein EI555_013185, partial [Monodon monoceros]